MIQIITKEQLIQTNDSPGVYVMVNNDLWTVIDKRGEFEYTKKFLSLKDAIDYINSYPKCRYCGCTSKWGCSEGCYWIDRSKTVCSSCIPL